MTYNFNEDYQYDSCISRGLCSINPRTSSLVEVLLLYLRLVAYYTFILYKNGIKDDDAKNLILNTISVIVSNSEFSENDFKSLTDSFDKILPILLKKSKEYSSDDDQMPELLQKILKYDTKDIIKAIRLGEKEFLKKTKELSKHIRSLYQILFLLAKSLCINVLDLATYGIDAEDGYIAILKILNSLNFYEQDEDKIKTCIETIALIDNELMKKIQIVQEERYGKSSSCEVGYSTYPGKAILVVGSNIRELEDILEAVKNENIDVYTHDEMILANTFPKFREYKNLKGQYGQGVENCLLDFSTFPGPIILTRHSLYNVENLYRGLLYTTDFATSKGVIPIINRNFSDVIDAAKKSRGFKTGKECDTVSIGLDYDLIFQNVKEKVKNFSKIFIIGLGAYNMEQKSYFEKLLTRVPKDVFIISLSYCREQENIFCVDACFDFYAITRIAEYIKNYIDKELTLFIPKCDRHTIAQIVYLKKTTNAKIFLGKCTPIMINPNMINIFQDVFDVKSITSVKKDLGYNL